MSASTVRDAMTVSPTTIEAHENAVDAARLMAAQDVGSLPVLEGEELVGIVTDRDLVLHVLAKDVDPHKVVVSSICSENPVVVGPEDSLDVALQRMAHDQIRRLPVVEDRRLVGILAHRRAGCDRSDGRGDLGALSSGGGRRCGHSVFSRNEDRQPGIVVARRRLDAVRQAREDEREARVALGTGAKRAD